jgi:hypothetical protein
MRLRTHIRLYVSLSTIVTSQAASPMDKGGGAALNLHELPP